MVHDTMCPSSVFNNEQREIPEPESFQSYDPTRRMCTQSCTQIRRPGDRKSKSLSHSQMNQLTPLCASLLLGPPILDSCHIH